MEHLVNSVKAESGVERIDGRQTSVPPTPYPWLAMAVDDSFVLPNQGIAYNLVGCANKILAPKKFSSGKDAAGRVRIWRIA